MRILTASIIPALDDITAASPLTDGPAEIRFALEPVSDLWDKDNRIRVSVLNADETLMRIIPQNPAPTASLWRDANHPSGIQLHLIE